ncbi:MAG: MFS transporter [Fusobacteria bacterium]|nr:MFS transporter [Fusobacteriota bacterium]
MDSVISTNSLVNKVKISIVMYIMMLTCGMAVILPFVLKSQAAAAIGISADAAGYAFSFYMVGMLIGQIISGYITKIVNLKTEMIAIAIIFLVCIASLGQIHSVSALVVVEIVIGIMFGILVTLPFFIVVHTFEGSSRASQSNILDLFFGIGSFTFPLIVARMFINHIDWKMTYALIFIIWIIILIVMIFTKLPNVSKVNAELAEKNHIEDKKHFSKWTVNVFLMAIVIFLDFVIFTGFNYYMPEFLNLKYHITLETAFLGLTVFWICYAIGCGVAGAVVKVMPENIYIMVSAIIGFVGIIMIFFAVTPTVLFISVAVFGYGCSTIYGSAIAFGSSILQKPSPRVVSFFICISGIGTWFGEFYATWIHQKFGSAIIIVISGILMIVLFIIVGYVSMVEKRKGNISHTK